MKTRRHNEIIKLIKTREIGTQEELLKLLKSRGYDKYVTILKEGFISMISSGNLIVLKTVTGMAMAVATAIDALEMNEIIGCIAGDDTIFIAVFENNNSADVMDKLKKLIKES